jgi:ABC-2 type transport system ATP-binding protein
VDLLPTPTASDAASTLPPPSAAVVIDGLVKRFGGKLAIDRLSLVVPRRSFFGLVGPNGAGKTTTLRMLTGLLRPDDGNVCVHGVWAWPDPAGIKPLLGVVPDGLLLFERLTGGEMLQYAGLLRGLDEAEATRRAGELLDVLGLTADAGKLVIDYSHGMRKKTALAAALIHRPQVLVLDEPFEGIDPVSSVNIRAMLERFTASGGTIVLSSHVMDVVERLCDHVAVIDDGRIIASGPVDVVRGGRRLEDAFLHLLGGDAMATDTLAWLDAPG